MAYKEAAFRHFFNRSIQVPLNEENFRTEIRTIIQIGLRNGYDIDDLQRIYNKIHVKNINNLIYPNIKQNKRYVVLDYHSTKTLPINKALQRYNITTAIRTNNKISHFLINCKHQPPKTEKSGVYQIKCDHCNKFYVGQSGRSLGERFDEHTKRKQSALGEHLKDTGHKTSLDNLTLLHRVKKSYKMTLLEEYEIQKRKAIQPNDILNNITDTDNNRMSVTFLKIPPNT